MFWVFFVFAFVLLRFGLGLFEVLRFFCMFFCSFLVRGAGGGGREIIFFCFCLFVFLFYFLLMGEGVVLFVFVSLLDLFVLFLEFCCFLCVFFGGLLF